MVLRHARRTSVLCNKIFWAHLTGKSSPVLGIGTVTVRFVIMEAVKQDVIGSVYRAGTHCQLASTLNAVNYETD